MRGRRTWTRVAIGAFGAAALTVGIAVAPSGADPASRGPASAAGADAGAGAGAGVGAGVGASSMADVGAGSMGFTDDFGHAVNRDPTYGLNDSLDERQRSDRRGITYTRASGVWNDTSAPRSWYSQVNHPERPGALSFWRGHSAVRLDAPVVAGEQGRIRARTVLDPIDGDTGSKQWASVMLAESADDSGYVSGSGIALGVLVRSDGAVQVFHRGRIVGTMTATPNGKGRFAVTLTSRPGSTEATVEVNGARSTVEVTGLPDRAWLFLGAYLDDPEASSSFLELGVADVDASEAGLPPDSGLQHFGYFGARMGPDTGNHVPAVRGRSNLNYVNISDYSRYAPEALDECEPNSCVVYTGFEFFTGCGGKDSPDCRLYDNYRERWQRLADAVRPKLDRVAAFYLLDEPYHHGASAADVATAARTIQETFPDARIMLVEAGYRVDSIEVPAAVDWVGFDDYCAPMSGIEQTLRTLKARTQPDQGLFLFPPAAPLNACRGTSAPDTDAEIARLQWDYLELAERHPRVVGLMSFGLWVEGESPSDLPATTDAHERIAARILTR